MSEQGCRWPKYRMVELAFGDYPEGPAPERFYAAFDAHVLGTNEGNSYAQLAHQYEKMARFEQELQGVVDGAPAGKELDDMLLGGPEHGCVACAGYAAVLEMVMVEREAQGLPVLGRGLLSEVIAEARRRYKEGWRPKGLDDVYAAPSGPGPERL